MPFVKLDCGMLNSTIWADRVAREVFITALLLAEPREFGDEVPEIATRSLDRTGWVAPAGWYGFVPASGPGIVDRAGIDRETGLEALERLASHDPESRSQDYDGRRMIRVDGGFIILNYDKYRQRDYTAAERQRRFRERKKDNAVTSRNSRVTSRHVTQAEAEAEAEAEVDHKTIPPTKYHPDFLTFWEAYPSRGPAGNSKRDAAVAFRIAQEREGCDAAPIIAGAKAYRTWCEVRGWVKSQFVCMATTWLNQTRWQNDYTIGYGMLPAIPDGPERDAVIDRINEYMESKNAG